MIKQLLKYRKIGTLLLMVFLVSKCLKAQPVNNTKRTVNGITLYSDFTNASIAYYVQGELHLAHNTDGSPKLKIISLQNECVSGTPIQLTNIAQIEVELKNYKASDLEAISRKVGKILKPLPIERIEAHLLCPAVNKAKWVSLGQDKIESKNSAVIWTNQTFTLPIDNKEAEIMWTQIEQEKLAISFNTYYYAKMLVLKKTTEIEIIGDTTLTNQIGDIESNYKVDSSQYTVLAKSDAFAVAVDLSKHPKILEVDIVSCRTFPKRARIAVSCLDFSRNIRPDLFRKTIQLEAYRPNGRKIRIEGSFSRDDKEDRIYLQFDQLISTRRPLTYTVIEYPNNDYEETTSYTYEMDEWVGRLDITTLMLENRLSNETFYIEAAPEDWQSFVNSVSYQYNYIQNGKKEKLIGSISKNDISFLKTHSIFYDDDTVPSLAIQWLTEKGTIVKSEDYELEDYFFFVPF